MNRPIRATLSGPLRVGPTSRMTDALRIALLGLAVCLTPMMLAGAARAAEAPIAYQSESEAAFEQQLAGGQIQAVTINKRLRSLRITLKDGRHVLARYPPKQEPRALAQIKGKGVPVTVLGKTQAEAELKNKPVHHKIRYIVGGVLLAVIIVVGTVLLINRRRRQREDE